ncbi:MAG: methionyl-tRNA formyltransferase [Pirellulales bacterium]
MRIFMMGTGGYAVPTFRAVHASAHNVAAVFTQPDVGPAGRKKTSPNPMREAAGELGIEVFNPHDADSAEAHRSIQSQQPDLLVVCDYGQILAAETLALAAHGGFNLHASLLPKYRGAAPINWAIEHGETETGNSVIHMTPQIDGGPCVAQERILIGADETAEELEVRMAHSGAQLVLQAIDDLEADRLQPIPQDASQVSRAPKLKKADGQIEWSRTAQQIFNQVRAMRPWPKTFSNWIRPGREPLRLIFEIVRVGESISDAPPGEVVDVTDDRISIATGDGCLLVEQLQPAGKRVLSAAEFLRGYPLQLGERFGDR